MSERMALARRGDAPGSLETYHAACLLIVFLDALTHYICGFERCAGIFLAGRGLQEVGVGIEREDRGVADVFGCLESACFEDDFHQRVAAGVFHLDDLVADFLIVLVEKVSEA